MATEVFRDRNTSATLFTGPARTDEPDRQWVQIDQLDGELVQMPLRTFRALAAKVLEGDTEPPFTSDERPIVTITISGPMLSGKTTLAAALCTLVQEIGVAPAHIQFETPHDTDQLQYLHLLDHPNDAAVPLRQIAETGVQIVLREVHVNRAGKKIG